MIDPRQVMQDAYLARQGKTRQRPYRPQPPAKLPAAAAEKSGSSKLGPVSVTMASQASCPTSCVFLGAGCYAENGFIGGFITKRLTKHPETDPVAIAQAEADKIDKLTGTRPLRLHVVGDSFTVEGTRILAAAVERYTARGGGRAWTYTHAWRVVPREAWGPISVLASCETADDVARARMRGYAAALVVRSHPSDKLGEVLGGGHAVLPCPEQTRGIQCNDCRLCLDDTRLREQNIAIAFALHGSGHKQWADGSRGLAGRSLDAATARA